MRFFRVHDLRGDLLELVVASEVLKGPEMLPPAASGTWSDPASAVVVGLIIAFIWLPKTSLSGGAIFLVL